MTLRKPCRWEEDGDGVWWTACGEAFQYHEGGPDENKQKFCGYCGGSIKAVKHEG